MGELSVTGVGQDRAEALVRADAVARRYFGEGVGWTRDVVGARMLRKEDLGSPYPFAVDVDYTPDRSADR